jgi:hypothetical protein
MIIVHKIFDEWTTQMVRWVVGGRAEREERRRVGG